MKIKANDETVEDLALQVAALRITLITVIAHTPGLAQVVRSSEDQVADLLQVLSLSDAQIARVREVIAKLSRA